MTNTTSSLGDEYAQEWVAIAITYQLGEKDVSYSTLKNLIEEIEFDVKEDDNDTEYWILLEPTTSGDTPKLDDSKGYAIFMYNKVLKSKSELAEDDDKVQTGESTTPLFEKIVIKSTEDLETIANPGDTKTGLEALNEAMSDENNTVEYTVNGNLPSFKINVIGAAVKNEYYAYDATTGEYKTNLATNIDDLKATDYEALKQSLSEVLQKELEQNGDLGYVTSK